MGTDAPRPETYRVLLVEDSRLQARVQRTALVGAKDVGFKVTAVGTMAHAAEAARTTGYDAVLLDLMLPDSEGIETVKAMRALVDEAPIIVLTATDDTTIAIEAVRHGAQSYVVKSELDPASLPRIVITAIERHRLVSQLLTMERRYRRLLDRMRDPVWLLNQTFEIEYANDAGLHLAGHSDLPTKKDSLRSAISSAEQARLDQELSSVSDELEVLLVVRVTDHHGLQRTLELQVARRTSGYEIVGRDLTALTELSSATLRARILSLGRASGE